jgi:hypothetical protein
MIIKPKTEIPRIIEGKKQFKGHVDYITRVNVIMMKTIGKAPHSGTMCAWNAGKEGTK